MLNESELYQMIHSPEESWRLEKTIGLKDTTKFGEAICSFANDLPDEGMPGYLLIGVDKHNKIAGMQLDESIEQNLLDFSKDGRIIPAPVIMTKLFHLVEGDVCVAKVLPSTHTPLRFNGKICVRKGPRKDYANEQEEKILIEKRNRFGHTFDIQPCLNATLEDVDTKSFSLLYLPLAIDSETLEVNHRPMELQMSSLQFYSSRHHVPTHAGIIMLAYKPTHFIPGAAIQYVKFDGPEIFADDVVEKLFDQNMLKQLDYIRDFIKLNIVKSYLPELGSAYEYNYPARALEELIFNAIIHNDYTVNAPIKIYEFQDRIEITNNGGLYGNATQNFPYNTDYRNPIIASAAKVLGFVNRFGVGVQRAIAELQKNGNPTPEFITNLPGKFVVKVWAKK